MSVFEHSPQSRSFVKVIILLLCLLSTGTPVFSSYQSPFHFTIPEGCTNELCDSGCTTIGFTEVSPGPSVPMMFHGCLKDTLECYCSIQTDGAGVYDWKEGKLITKYICEKELAPAEEDDRYSYIECHGECTYNGYKESFPSLENSESFPSLENTESFPTSSAGVDLKFHLIQDDECCCSGKPQFSSEMYEYPEVDTTDDSADDSDSSEVLEGNGGTTDEDHGNSDDDSNVSAVEDDGDSVVGKGKMEDSSAEETETETEDSDELRQEIPGKRPWDSDTVDYEYWNKKYGDPERGSSGTSVDKRPRLSIDNSPTP